MVVGGVRGAGIGASYEERGVEHQRNLGQVVRDRLVAVVVRKMYGMGAPFVTPHLQQAAAVFVFFCRLFFLRSVFFSALLGFFANLLLPRLGA